jgi:hypothetical protein
MTEQVSCKKLYDNKKYDDKGNELLFCDRIINPYKDENAKVVLGLVLLSQSQIDDLKYKGECLATDEQHEILNKYEGDEKWNHIHNGWKIRDYIFS